MARLAPFAPAGLALVFGAWCGTFGEGAGWAAAGAAALLLLAPVPAVGPSWRDPWRLGRAGALLLPALLAAVVLSWLLSPVVRAGRVGVLVLPAFLALPAVLARCWERPAAVRMGTRALSAVVGAVAATSLALWLSGVTPRPALPVGQHLHLTAWLALLLPLALLPWRDGGGWRWLAGASGALAVAAVVAARTLAGGLALVLEGALAVAWIAAARRRSGRGRGARPAAVAAALALVAVVAVLGADLAAVVRGTDPSFAARRVYWQAGWSGFLERPGVGFGPGATAWTLGAFLRPVPGVNPPSEVVGELHLLPLAAAYELGVPGVLLAAAAVALFAWRRLRERASGGDVGLLGAGLLGLAGGAAAGLATADWRVLALPVAAVIAAGAALAGGRVGDRSRVEEGGGRSRRLSLVAPGLYAVAAVAALLPLVLAHRAYDRAAGAPRREALRHLDRAVALDPGFPLYRARRGWLAAEGSEDRAGLADSLAAARGAPGVGALWLTAGAVAEAAGDRAGAAFAFERACGLDPLGALAPFRLAQVGSPVHDPVAVAARAVAADPRLAGALWWRGREDLLARVSGHLATTPGIEQGWRAAMVEGVDARLESATEGAPEAVGSDVRELALVLDGTPRDSVSLHLFRRRLWRARLAGVPVDAAWAAAFAEVPAAVSLAGTDPRLFPPTCTGGFVPQRLRKTLWKSW